MNHCDEIVGRENRRVAGCNQIMNHWDEIVGRENRRVAGGNQS